jgi:hypothetical protein
MWEPLNEDVIIIAGWVGGWNLIAIDLEDLEPCAIWPFILFECCNLAYINIQPKFF